MLDMPRAKRVFLEGGRRAEILAGRDACLGRGPVGARPTGAVPGRMGAGALNRCWDDAVQVTRGAARRWSRVVGLRAHCLRVFGHCALCLRASPLTAQGGVWPGRQCLVTGSL
jgi:hypothetical protein